MVNMGGESGSLDKRGTKLATRALLGLRGALDSVLFVLTDLKRRVMDYSYSTGVCYHNIFFRLHSRWRMLWTETEM